MYLVVGTSGQLNVASALEVCAVGSTLITEIVAVVVQAKRWPAWWGVEFGLEFAKRREVSCFRTDGGQGHKNHWLICEPGISQSLKDKRKILLDVSNRYSRKHLGNDLGGDARNRWRGASRNSGTNAAATAGGRARVSGSGGCAAELQGFHGLRARYTISRETLAFLKSNQSTLRSRTKVSINSVRVETQLFQSRLQ